MPANIDRIDTLIQYILLVAGSEDEYIDRQLGPIHIIKYVYMADLAYAARNSGNIFTGVNWQFYKFGPWSLQVNERIEPALNLIAVEKRTFASSYEDKEEWGRWALRNDQLLSEKEREIPVYITSTLSRDIHKFGNDTSGLLDHVYKTKPMLSAEPNEYLDFSRVIDDVSSVKNSDTLKFESLSARKKHRLKVNLQALRDKRGSFSKTKSDLVNPVNNPRYDQVYHQGLAWLDSLAGPQMVSEEGVVKFSKDVWKSSTRKGLDVP